MAFMVTTVGLFPNAPVRGVVQNSPLCERLCPQWQSAYKRVDELLRHAVRASSAVECVNSVVRMHQGCHRHVSQGLLDLKRLYWNCRVFREGKRKGKSPYALLGLHSCPAQIGGNSSRWPQKSWSKIVNSISCGLRRSLFGRRKDEVFLKLKALLEPFGLTRYYTDHWGAYTRHLDPDVHSPGKRNTQKIERKHLTLRTRIKRLVRKTICFSKSTQMHDIVIGLFVNRYAFGRAVFTTGQFLISKCRYGMQ